MSFMIIERHKHRQNKWSFSLECWLEKGLADLCLVLRGLDTYEIFFSLISYNLHSISRLITFIEEMLNERHIQKYFPILFVTIG
jgi:hypothetical protein